MSDEEWSDLFDTEPAFGNQPVPSVKDTNYFAFGAIQIAADLSIALPSDLWMSIFALLSVEPHQVWWRILSEVSKHTNHSLKLYLKHIQFARFHSSSTIAEYLAGEGYLSCLQYAHENGARWDVTTCMNANLDCLKYAHENACEWNELTCYYSALHNRVDCLKYAHEHGCEWTYTTAFAAAKNNHLECLKYCYENGCPRAPQYANTYYDTSSVMSTAASNGSLDCIKYLHEQQGESWTEALLIVMTKYGHLDCIKYAIQRGCPYNKETICSFAADDLECLIYFHEKGHPWDIASTGAARHGNIDCLKYIHEHGGEWLGDEITMAYRFGALECLKYAFENGCPFPADLCRQRGYYTPQEVIDYAHSKVECTCYYDD